MLAAGLLRALERAGIPVLAVSIGNDVDRTTWRVDFKPEATSAQRDAAAAICASYDFSADSTYQDEGAAKAFDSMKAIKAVAISALWGRLGRQPTGAEIQSERTRILNIYRTL
jgi:hypothetical protein